MNGLWIIVIAVLMIVPFWRLLPRYGIHQYWSLLAALPAVGLILLWIIAFKEEEK